MSEESNPKLARLQAIMTALLKRRMGDSLAGVEAALRRWRAGELGEFEAHGEVLQHAARTERLAAHMARVGFDCAHSLMRDAYDAGLVGREEFVDLMGLPPEQVQPTPDLDELDDAEPALPAKRQVVDELMGGGAVLVHVDARCDGVQVPERFRDDARLVLRFGYNLTPAIPDLNVNDDGICGTLTFRGVPHRCVLPWRSIYAVVSETSSRGLVWPDDVPDEVVGELAGAIDGEREGDEPPEPPDGGGASRRPSHLRLVK